jgi:hypothetical protein
MTPLRARGLAAMLTALGLVACGSDDGVGVGVDGGSMTCRVESIAEPNGSDGEITAVGTIRCSREATLDLTACVQRAEGDEFEDLECDGAARMGVSELDVGTAAPCAPGDGHRYRAIVRALVNGTESPEHASEAVTCD